MHSELLTGHKLWIYGLITGIITGFLSGAFGIGAAAYIQLALMVGLQPNDMKLVSAVIVVLALLIPRWGVFANVRARRRARNLPAEPDVTASIEDRDPVSGLVKPGA